MLTLLFDGVAYGMLLFILAVGLCVTMGLMNFINLAHGAFAMLGGYLTVALMQRHGVPFLVCLPLAFLASALVGAVMERTLYRPMYKKPHLDQVLFSIGLAFMAVATADYLMGSQQQIMQLPDWLRGRTELFEGRHLVQVRALHEIDVVRTGQRFHTERHLHLAGTQLEFRAEVITHPAGIQQVRIRAGQVGDQLIRDVLVDHAGDANTRTTDAETIRHRTRITIGGRAEILIEAACIEMQAASQVDLAITVSRFETQAVFLDRAILLVLLYVLRGLRQIIFGALFLELLIFKGIGLHIRVVFRLGDDTFLQQQVKQVLDVVCGERRRRHRCANCGDSNSDTLGSDYS